MYTKDLLEFRLNPTTQTVKHLLNMISRVSANITVESVLFLYENQEYPVHIRKEQIKCLKELINTLEESIEKVGV